MKIQKIVAILVLTFITVFAGPTACTIRYVDGPQQRQGFGYGGGNLPPTVQHQTPAARMEIRVQGAAPSEVCLAVRESLTARAVTYYSSNKKWPDKVTLEGWAKGEFEERGLNLSPTTTPGSPGGFMVETR